MSRAATSWRNKDVGITDAQNDVGEFFKVESRGVEEDIRANRHAVISGVSTIPATSLASIGHISTPCGQFNSVGRAAQVFVAVKFSVGRDLMREEGFVDVVNRAVAGLQISDISPTSLVQFQNSQTTETRITKRGFFNSEFTSINLIIDVVSIDVVV